MPIKVTCTNCGGALHAPDDSLGKRGRCPTCGSILTIQPDASGPPPAFGAPPMGGGPNVGAPGGFQPGPTQTPLNNPWGSLPGGPEDGLASSAPMLGGPRPGQGPVPSIAPPPAASLPTASPGYGSPKDSSPPVPNPWGGPAASAPKFPEPANGAPANRGSRVPPDPRKFPVADPFAKPGRPPIQDDEASTRRWLKVKRGLGWVQAALLFGFLAIVGFAAVPILQTVGVNLPNETPGFLKNPSLSQTTEIHLLATLAPLALALLCKLIGRSTVSGAPASSFARGPAMLASLMTMLAIGGAVAYGYVTGSAMKPKEGEVVWLPNVTPLLNKPTDSFQVKVERYFGGLCLGAMDFSGQLQRVGLIVFVVFGLMAEVLFIATLGRMAAALRSSTAAGRVNRFLAYITFIVLLTTIAVLGYHLFDKDWANANVFAKWEALDEKLKTYATFGGVAAVGLIGMMIYWRMLSGVKRAIRETYDQ